MLENPTSTPVQHQHKMQRLHFSLGEDSDRTFSHVVKKTTRNESTSAESSPYLLTQSLHTRDDAGY
jgi:hypothetical protein